MILPLMYRVIVKPVNLEDTDPAFAAAKRAGIEILKNEKAREEGGVDRGTILYIGPSVDPDLLQSVSVGDEVFFARYAGKKIEDPYTKEKVLALNDEDIVAKIIKEDKND